MSAPEPEFRQPADGPEPAEQERSSLLATVFGDLIRVLIFGVLLGLILFAGYLGLGFLGV